MRPDSTQTTLFDPRKFAAPEGGLAVHLSGLAAEQWMPLGDDEAIQPDDLDASLELRTCCF